MGVLRNVKYERFAQLIAQGIAPNEAAEDVGYKSSYGLLKKQVIDDRIKELLKNAAARAELTRRDIYNGIFDDIQLARKLGQPAAALKGWEMLGKDLHRMFVERKEVGGPGDFDGKTEEELREFLAKELASLGMPIPDELKASDGTSKSTAPAVVSPGSDAIN